MQVLERFTQRILTRQRAMYEDPDVPFIEKWRKAMNFIDVDLEAGYPKIWYELQAMAWNKPEFRARLAQLYQQWDKVLTDAVATAMREYGLDRRKYPAQAISTLVRTFNEGLLLERLSGYDTGHGELLKMIDNMLQRWERNSS
jgi:hypothetical protein